MLHCRDERRCALVASGRCASATFVTTFTTVTDLAHPFLASGSISAYQRLKGAADDNISNDNSANNSDAHYFTVSTNGLPAHRNVPRSTQIRTAELAANRHGGDPERLRQTILRHREGH